jgi:glutamate/aspartate transport system substrate-binding protein
MFACSTVSPGDYIVSDEALSIEPYGIMMRRDYPAFKKVVDDAVATVYRSGEIEKIYAKWFLVPTPPKNINLSVPMSAPLKHAVEHLTDSGDPDAYRAANSTQ